MDYSKMINIRKTCKIGLPFILLLIATSLQAQLGFRTNVDKNRILIGEQFRLNLEIRISSGQQLSPFSIDSIPHFEILDAGNASERIEGNEKIIERQLLLTSFDSGHWVIPSFRISSKYVSDTIPMDVVFSEFDPSKDYHDVKDIIEIEPEHEKRQWWYAAIAAVLLVALIAWLLLRKKKKPVAVPVLAIDPYTEAIRQLDQLQRENYDPRRYYTELVDIFRLYIFRKKGLLSLQKTTDDLILQLKPLGMENSEYSKLQQTLRLSDFVKFAKFVPSNDDNRNSIESIRSAIQTIEKMP